MVARSPHFPSEFIYHPISASFDLHFRIDGFRESLYSSLPYFILPISDLGWNRETREGFIQGMLDSLIRKIHAYILMTVGASLMLLKRQRLYSIISKKSDALSR
jgi:hypothetical protein